MVCPHTPLRVGCRDVLICRTVESPAIGPHRQTYALIKYLAAQPRHKLFILSSKAPLGANTICRDVLIQGGGVDVAAPPPSGGAEFSEAPKKIFDLNELAPKPREKSFDRPKARKQTFGPIVITP